METELNLSGGESNDDGETYSSVDGDENIEYQNTPFLRGKHFDIEAYARNYRDRDKILRLRNIAWCMQSKDEQRQAMELEALRLAYEEAKKGKNVDLFCDIADEINGRLGPNFGRDEDWCDSINQTRKLMEDDIMDWLSRCQDDFSKDELSVEGMKTVLYYVANFIYEYDSASTACSYYMDCHSYCHTKKDYRDFLMHSVHVLVELQFFLIIEDIAKISSIGKDAPDAIFVGTVHCAMGLACLSERKYRDAADWFLGISIELGSGFPIVMAAHDIAAYGGMCALATMERTDLKNLVLENNDFQCYLNSAIEVKELICDFYSSRFSSCLEHLDNLKEWLLYDIYMHHHFKKLYDKIRKKALIIYIRPFVSVDMKTMAHTFHTNIERLEMELKALIQSNQIKAKIDSIGKALFVVQKDQRNETFSKVLGSLNEIERDIRSMVLHEECGIHHQ